MIPDLGTATWRKSSRSGGNGGQCVELALIGEHGAARDSKNPEGDVLIFGGNALAFFLNATKTGRF
ncbi:DUF397 domain-containing protein [Lentzea sp. DG1S-22]|uniref:DUF397 domain-containing protein n=1 Tax=Lentzea sp. DG1S-22 TaxID=3108822 RepID=UPI002E76F35E|nr:DUF397 domain-containing protein [Lentzea sp. DG1S-22]WVH78452.1 DUF397 domain-containing protein [Lentzea sp. DG1S-22]